jgi:hypothetical protein
VTSAWVFQCEYHHAILDRSWLTLSESSGPGKCLINAVTVHVNYWEEFLPVSRQIRHNAPCHPVCQNHLRDLYCWYSSPNLASRTFSSWRAR